MNRCTGWPSSASQRMTPLASTVATLLEIATWVCRSGSPARESRWVKAAPSSPVVSTWATPLVPDRVNAAWVSNHCQRVRDGRVVAFFDDRRDVHGCDRPQRRHRLHRREGQVVARDRGGARPGFARYVAGEFAVVGGRAAVLFGELSARDDGADRGAGGRVDGRVPVRADFGVVVAVGHGQGAGEGGFAVADVEPATQFGGFAGREAVHSTRGHIGGDRIGVGVQPFSEKRFHLCFADLGAGLHRPHVGDIARQAPSARRWTPARPARSPPSGQGIHLWRSSSRSAGPCRARWNRQRRPAGSGTDTRLRQ